MVRATVETPPPSSAGPTGEVAPGAARDRAVRIALGVSAAVLVAVAWKLPIWHARMSVPQYPEGLRVTASGSGVDGDIAEINELNHYVGIEAISEANAPEMKLWGLVILVALAAVVVATVLPPRSLLARLARLGVWLIPLGALLDVQYRLYESGHSVQPDAAIRLDPFTPLVVGTTHVLNFTTFAYPGLALWCLLGVAYLLTLGPWTVRRLREWLATRGADGDVPAGAAAG